MPEYTQLLEDCPQCSFDKEAGLFRIKQRVLVNGVTEGFKHFGLMPNLYFKFLENMRRPLPDFEEWRSAQVIEFRKASGH